MSLVVSHNKKWKSEFYHEGPSAASPQPKRTEIFTTKLTKAHEGKEIRRNFVPNFVLFVYLRGEIVLARLK